MVKSKAAKRIAMIVILVVGVLLFRNGQAEAANCRAELYRNGDFSEVMERFSPYDKVVVIVTCEKLPEGPHVMHANWVHQKQGLVRSDTYSFSQTGEDNSRAMFFWFKLRKKGPLASALTNADFHASSFGGWKVEIYLDDILTLTNDFSIVQ